MGQDLVLDSISSFKQRTRCVTLHHDIPSSKMTTLLRVFFCNFKTRGPSNIYCVVVWDKHPWFFFSFFDSVEWFVLIAELMFIYLWLMCAVLLYDVNKIWERQSDALRWNIFVVIFVVIRLSHWACVGFIFHGFLFTIHAFW